MSEPQHLDKGLGAPIFAEGDSVIGGDGAVTFNGNSELTEGFGATYMLASMVAGSKSTFALGAHTKFVISSASHLVSEIIVKAGIHAKFEDGVAAKKLVLNPGSSAHFEGVFSVTDIVAPAEGDGVTEGAIVSCGKLTAGQTITIGRNIHVNFERDFATKELVLNPGASAHFAAAVSITDISSVVAATIAAVSDADAGLERADTSGAATPGVEPLGDVSDLN